MKYVILYTLIIILLSLYCNAEQIQLTQRYYTMNFAVNRTVEKISFIQVPHEHAYDWAFFNNTLKSITISNRTKAEYTLKIPRNTEPGFYNLTYAIDGKRGVLEIEIVHPLIMRLNNFFDKKYDIFSLKVSLGLIVLSFISLILFFFMIIESIKFINN